MAEWPHRSDTLAIDYRDDGLRTGAQYLADICNDGRQVMYDGEVVHDVTTHPAFRAAA